MSSVHSNIASNNSIHLFIQFFNFAVSGDLLVYDSAQVCVLWAILGKPVEVHSNKTHLPQNSAVVQKLKNPNVFSLCILNCTV